MVNSSQTSLIDLSIIIVNWNSKEYIFQCIASIMANTKTIEFEIIVIDAASFDGCDKMLQRFYPKVIFIQAQNNLGFAKANNEAYKLSNGRNIVFLNPDTEIQNQALEILIREIESLPQIGIVGAKLLNSDKSIQTSCIQPFPNIINQFLTLEIFRKRFPLVALWGTYPLVNKNNRPTEVEAVSGACLMIRREVFEKVGKFSSDYFMYTEDIDLCFKVKQNGWKIYFVPMAQIIHHGGGSSSQSNLSTFSCVMMIESQFRFFKKTKPFWYRHLYRISILVSSLFRIIILFLIWPLFKKKGKGSQVEKSFKKWVSRFKWTLGLENWVKNY